MTAPTARTLLLILAIASLTQLAQTTDDLSAPHQANLFVSGGVPEPQSLPLFLTPILLLTTRRKHHTPRPH